MNDPHVESLTYTLVPGASTSYADDASPVEIRGDGFLGRLARGSLTITLSDHHADAKSARLVVEPQLRAWEVVAALESGRSEFTFQFEGSVIIDRKPATAEGGGTSHSVAVEDFLHMSASMTAHVMRGSYPEPTTRPFAFTPEVEMLMSRWRLVVEGRDSILAGAYFCLTLIEIVYGGGHRDRAAAMFGISRNVLQTLGRLTARGDPETARKYSSAAQALMPSESTWVERTVRELILRCGEVSALGDAASLPQLTLADLPSLSAGPAR